MYIVTHGDINADHNANLGRAAVLAALSNNTCSKRVFVTNSLNVLLILLIR